MPSQGRCAVKDGVLRTPCSGLLEVIGTQAIELRFVFPTNVPRAGRRAIASYLLLRRKFIVFWCPCCGERIGTSDHLNDENTISSTYQQVLAHALVHRPEHEVGKP